MYRQLLTAIEGMERSHPSTGEPRSPLVEELDLFVTATDITGLTLPLQLSDLVVQERRHRNVFHFVYATAEATGDDRNDYWADNDPFLAFAARCTSAFPFAFEPMRLRDIDAILDGDPIYRNRRDLRSDGTAWNAFIKDYLRADIHPFADRSFGDGGYLNNKPFSYATETLLRRRADRPVDRKLIYIEPSPEHPEREPDRKERPDALQNTMDALVVLPQDQTIREDLQRVLDRNRFLDRIVRVLRGSEQDVERHYPNGRPPVPSATAWGATDLGDMLAQKGLSYGVYHRLKIGTLTEELAELIARLAGFEENSDRAYAIRQFVRVWREATYTPYRVDTKPTENQWLLEVDLSYRLRRLNFVFDKIDELIPLDANAREILQWAGVRGTAQPTAEEKPQFLADLHAIRRELNRAFIMLRRVGRQLRSRHASNPLCAHIPALGVSAADLDRILQQPTEEKELTEARALLAMHAPALQALASALVEQLRPVFTEASRICASVLMPSSGTVSAAHRCLWHFYQHYDDYDLITFPIVYGTNVGEADTVEIIRISPEDAPSIIDEQHSSRRKLAGTSLFHFGAFLDRIWRENDILWGRLDAAERILMALLPDAHPLAAERAALLEEAQLAIIDEELRRADLNTLCQLLANALTALDPKTPNERALRQLVEEQFGSPINPKLQAVLRACLSSREILAFLRSGYTVNRELSGPTMLRDLSRATRVTGKLLEGLADKYHLSKKPVAWIAWLGAVMCGLVEVSIPQRLPAMLWHHWLKILYLLELLLIAGGWGFGLRESQRLGWYTFGVTAAVHCVTKYLRCRMKSAGKRK
jgi:patatin-related protein